MPVKQAFVQGLSFNLSAALSAVATTLTPPSYASWPATGQFDLKCESEIFTVTNAATHPWPLVRGVNSTAVSHVLGALVTAPLTIDALDRIVEVRDEGTPISETRVVDFTGAGVTVTNVAGVAAVDIPGGGSSADMTPSGTGHAHGLAPDPPASAGTTKFLREDASWAVPPGGGMTDPMTNAGDMIVRAGGVPSRLAVGSTGQVLTVASGAPSWATPSSGFANPMTTPADLIVGGTSGAPARLAKGSDGQVLTVDPTTHLLVWTTPAGGLSNPMTTPADLIVGGTSGAPARLAKGADSQVLTIDPSTHLIVWANASSGFSNPMTTKGDVIVADTGGTALRKAVGTDGQVLTADAASTGGVKWNTAGGGGGAAIGSTALGSEPGSPATGDLDLYTDAPYIARWSGSVWNRWRAAPLTDPSLGSWSWDNQQSSTITAIKGALSLHVPPSGGNLPSFRYKTAPSTPYTVDAIIIAEMAVLNDYLAYGIGFRESATGKIIILDFAPASSPRFYVRRYTDSSNYASDLASVAYQPPAPTFLRIADDGTNLTFSWSYSGITYIQLATQARTTFFTSAPNQVCFFGQGASGTNPCDVTLLSWTES